MMIQVRSMFFLYLSELFVAVIEFNWVRAYQGGRLQNKSIFFGPAHVNKANLSSVYLRA